MKRKDFYIRHWVVYTGKGTFTPSHLGDKEKAFFAFLDELEKSGVDISQNILIKKHK